MPRTPSPTLAALRSRIRLTRHSPGSPTPVAPEPAVASPFIEFVAYAEDCILEGRVRMGAERLADFINDREQVELADVLVTDLAGSKAIDLHALLVSRDEILAVHASGPRGSSGRRTRTRTHPVVAKLGPYEVRGYIHALPGSDPISGLRRRPPMVALTEARIDEAFGRVAALFGSTAG